MKRAAIVLTGLALGLSACGTAVPDAEAPDYTPAAAESEVAPEETEEPAPEETEEPAPEETEEPEATPEETEESEPTPEATPEEPETTPEETEEPGTTPEQTEEPAPEAAPAGEPNERGNLVAEVGTPIQITNDAGDTVAELTLTEVQPDFTCPSEYAEPPENGQFVGLTFDVQTFPPLGEEEILDYFALSQFDFTILSPEGQRENDSSGSSFLCLDSGDQFPYDVGPSQSAGGMIVLDTANPSGILVYESYFDYETSWEWIY